MLKYVALAALLTAAPSIPQDTPRDTSHNYNSRVSSAFPPPRFHAAEVGLPVLFVNDVTPLCGGAPPGYRVMACVRTMKGGGRVMILPNPCSAEYAFQSYSHLVCHEKAHAVGWSGNHEE